MKRILPKIAAVIATISILGSSALAQGADTNSPAAAPEKPGPNRFYGPVSAVDTNAMTFTVGDQTFKITGESQVTKNAKPATISDAVVGEPARGTYTKTTDGKLIVTKVRFGKNTGGKAGGKKKKANTDTNAVPSNP